MPRKKMPVSFDAWLGKVIDDEAATHGGRPAIARWIGASQQSVNRRARGEVPYLAREVQIVAEKVSVPVAELVERALRGYGGLGKLVEEYEVSEAIPKLSDYRKVDPATAPEEELRGNRAAGQDPELLEDEQFD